MIELLNDVLKFRDKRNWSQFHNPKDLALSISLEASELLENFQWKTTEEAINQNLENIQDEIADVFIYLLLLSHELDIDINEVTINKLKKK